MSIGGWTAVNYAVRRPGRAASLALLDPVLTFAPVPVKAMLVSAGMFVPVPEPLRRRVFSWISGGADVNDSLPEAALISAGSTDYVLRKAMPKSFTDDPAAIAERAGRCWHDVGRGGQRRVVAIAAADGDTMTSCLSSRSSRESARRSTPSVSPSSQAVRYSPSS